VAMLDNTRWPIGLKSVVLSEVSFEPAEPIFDSVKADRRSLLPFRQFKQIFQPPRLRISGP
jgi:hypothetical protein